MEMAKEMAKESTAVPAPAKKMEDIRLADIKVGKNDRGMIPPREVAALAASMQAEGQLVPVAVKEEDLTLIYGHRPA